VGKESTGGENPISSKFARLLESTQAEWRVSERHGRPEKHGGSED
jgi:hypothetical protein